MSRFDEKFMRRARRVRHKVRSSSARPRLSIFRSGRHIYAQIVDDCCGKTLCAASTVDKNFRGTGKSATCDAATKVGTMLAGKAIGVGIKEVIFDRGGYSYHGRVKALADGARGGGLLF